MIYFYVDLEFTIVLHNLIIENSGGLGGIKDEQQIQSILQHIQNDDYYQKLDDKATHLLFSLCKFHCFNDGNKRTSMAITKLFLEGNNCKVDDFYVNMEDVVVKVAEGVINKTELKKIISKYIKK